MFSGYFFFLPSITIESIAASDFNTVTFFSFNSFQFIFEQITLFTGVEGFEMELNKDFSYITFDAQIYTSLVNGYQLGVNTHQDVFNYLKSTGLILPDVLYEDWSSQVEDQIPLPVATDTDDGDTSESS